MTKFQFLTAVLAVTATSALSTVSFGQCQTNGSGAPSGQHYNLNIIGAPSTFSTVDHSGGNVIHVPLYGKSTIDLQQGPFQVIDDNATDADKTATFQLPNPDPTNSGTTTYSVFVKALGKPGGSSSQTTCFTDTATNTTYCSIYSSVQTSSTGKKQFTNVTSDLLYVYYYSSTGQLVRVPLFDSSTFNFYWNYDNNGLRNAQLRFYQCSTTVP